VKQLEGGGWNGGEERATQLEGSRSLSKESVAEDQTQGNTNQGLLDRSWWGLRVRQKHWRLSSGALPLWTDCNINAMVSR
jgi:hypothetical protein